MNEGKLACTMWEGCGKEEYPRGTRGGKCGGGGGGGGSVGGGTGGRGRGGREGSWKFVTGTRQVANMFFNLIFLSQNEETR